MGRPPAKTVGQRTWVMTSSRRQTQSHAVRDALWWCGVAAELLQGRGCRPVRCCPITSHAPLWCPVPQWCPLPLSCPTPPCCPCPCCISCHMTHASPHHFKHCAVLCSGAPVPLLCVMPPALVVARAPDVRCMAVHPPCGPWAALCGGPTLMMPHAPPPTMRALGCTPSLLALLA